MATAQVKVWNKAARKFEAVSEMVTIGRARALADALRARGHVAAIAY